MFANFFQPTLLLAQLLLVYLLSRHTINQLFYLLRVFFQSHSIVNSVISIFFLPGTIIHEFGHFIAATVLMLPVHEVHIFPQWEKNQIKLGSVLYEKKDIFRGILVGIAPLFFAFFFFWLLSVFKLFPNENILINIVFGYIVFTVSSTMFSSKQDLVDFAFIIPLVIMIVGIIYIFDIKPEYILSNRRLVEGVVSFFRLMNLYLSVSLIINLILIVFIRSFRFFIKR